MAAASVLVFTNPSPVALQDIAALLIGADKPADGRWTMHVNRAGAGSIQQAELPFGGDVAIAGSLAGSGALPVGAITVSSDKAAVPETPDEVRINRPAKAGRISAVVPAAPPPGFSAGTIFERQSHLLQPAVEAGELMSFAKPRIEGQELQIAAAFHPVEEQSAAPELPPVVAELVNNTEPDVLATAYAPAERDFATRSPFASLLKNDASASGRFIPPATDQDHAWLTSALPASSFSKNQQKCLADGVYFEARGEIARGQAAVAQVILNRVRNPAFPDTICDVVYQNRDWRNRCQFSFACDGIRDRITEPRRWKIANDIAMAATAGKIWLDDVGSSTHYHATYVHPRWAKQMQRLTRIGQHVFYRTRNGGWS